MNVVVDWDGTVTEKDTLMMALARFGDWAVYERAAAALERGESSRDHRRSIAPDK